MKRIWLIVLILLLVAAYQTFGAEPQTNPERDPGAFRKTGGTISGDVVMQHDLDVTGLATFTDAYFTHIDSAGAIEAAGTIIANSGIEVVGDMLASGTIWADAAAILGDLGVIGTLGVTGTATFSDDIHAEADVYLDSGNLSVTGTASVSGNIYSGTLGGNLGTMAIQNANAVDITGGVATLSAAAIGSATFNTSTLVVNSQGNSRVGIGTTTPQSLFTIQGPNSSSELFRAKRLGTASDGTGQGITILPGSTGLISAGTLLRHYSNDDSGTEILRNYIRFFDTGIQIASGTDQNVMTLLNTGYVGINTTTPQNTLSVAGGNIGFSNETAIVRETVDGADNSGFSLSGGGATGGSRGAYIQLYGNEHATASGSIQIAAGGNTGGHIKFVTNAANRMWITDAGYVGIATTTPQYPLQVIGNVAFGAATNTAAVNVVGAVYVSGDVSAQSFTDRTESPGTLADAYEIVKSHESIGGQLNHAKLSPKAWGKKSSTVKTGKKKARLIPASGDEPEKIVEEDETQELVEPDPNGRNMSMVISAQALVIKDLLKRIEALEAHP